MAMQFSTAVRDAMANSFEATVGTAPTLQLRSGPPPANCAATATGTVLATMVLPTDWMAAASAGAVSKTAAVWEDLSADAAGTVGHFRIVQGATCHNQGTVTITGGGGDMTLDNPTLEANQKVTITGYAGTVGGA